MIDLNFDNPWIFTPVTVALWIIIFTVIEVLLTDGSIQSGVIQGFSGGVAYSIAYKAFQKFSN